MQQEIEKQKENQMQERMEMHGEIDIQGEIKMQGEGKKQGEIDLQDVGRNRDLRTERKIGRDIEEDTDGDVERIREKSNKMKGELHTYHR